MPREIKTPITKKRPIARDGNPVSNSGQQKARPGDPGTGNACGVFLLRSNGPALTSGMNVRL